MAADWNQFQIIGRLGRDPEVRYLPSGEALASFSVANSFKPKDGDKKTTWFKFVAFGKNAENAGNLLKKGSQVFVQGRLQERSYEDKTGQTRTSMEAVVGTFNLISNPVAATGEADTKLELD